MIERVKNGEADIIICKDFSRFFRDYVEIGDYLERIFPFLGVRFISVNDNYDSDEYKGSTAGMEVVMKYIVYSSYSHDLSQKIKTVINAKHKKGQWVGSHAPYGYSKDKEDKNNLVPNPDTAPVVRKIFDLALKGKNTSGIAVILNELGTVFTLGISAEKPAEVSVDGTEMSFADFQNGFSEYASKSVVLLKDVVLPDDFASLGSLLVPFTGTFDGKGYTISNLKAPLFGKLQGATVQNLTLTGDIVMTGSSANGNNGGALTPRADGMTLRNCVSNVSLNFTPAAPSCIGAWAGFCGAGTITIGQCVNNGAVTVDYSGAKAHSIYVGGFIGKTNVGATISSSVNNGAVSGKTENSSDQSSQTTLMGGFIGNANKTVNVQKCVNNGAVRVTTSKGHGGHKVGGLIGVLEGGSTSNFTDCVNNGEVFAYVQAGGLVGTVNNIATLNNCYNYGDVISGGDKTMSGSSFAGGMIAYLNATGSDGAVIKNCVNYGNITSQANVSTKLEAYAGGIAGNIGGKVTLVAGNCLSKGTVKADLYAGGLFGYVNANCKKAEVGNSLVTGNVLLLESSLSGAASGAVIGQNMAAATVVLPEGYGIEFLYDSKEW